MDHLQWTSLLEWSLWVECWTMMWQHRILSQSVLRYKNAYNTWHRIFNRDFQFYHWRKSLSLSQNLSLKSLSLSLSLTLSLSNFLPLFLALFVQDLGTPTRTVLISLTINVIDVLDPAPQFTQSTYRVEVAEGTYSAVCTHLNGLWCRLWESSHWFFCSILLLMWLLSILFILMHL